MKKTINGMIAFAAVSFVLSCNMGKDKNEVVTTDTSSTVNVTDNMTTTTPDSAAVAMNTDTASNGQTKSC